MSDCNKRLRCLKVRIPILRQLDLDLLGELPMSRDIAGLAQNDEGIQSAVLKETIDDITEKVIISVKKKLIKS